MDQFEFDDIKIKEIRKLMSRIKYLENKLTEEFQYNRDVREFMGDYIDCDELIPVLYHKGNYVLFSNRSAMLHIVNKKLPPTQRIKPNTFRNWVKEHRINKLEAYEINIEYLARIHYYDEEDRKKPTSKYITTRGDVLHNNLKKFSFPPHKNEFIMTIDGDQFKFYRSNLVFIKFIDRRLSQLDEPNDYLLFLDGNYGNCDISNLTLRTEKNKKYLGDVLEGLE
jgi:hypothetical protein